ncbi:MAG: hypothetical protein IV086_16440 [Hyphomonadaceae bacterium]|nr:hypothetical protein [Hyphomonadaceae bacterium]
MSIDQSAAARVAQYRHEIAERQNCIDAINGGMRTAVEVQHQWVDSTDDDLKQHLYWIEHYRRSIAQTLGSYRS